jgi:hypothetical protein
MLACAQPYLVIPKELLFEGHKQFVVPATFGLDDGCDRTKQFAMGAATKPHDSNAMLIERSTCAVSEPVGSGHEAFQADFFSAFGARRVFLDALFTAAAFPEMAKCSSFLPLLSAAASQRGFSPRAAHVSE